MKTLSLVGKGDGWERTQKDFEEGRDVWCTSTIFEGLTGVGVQPTRIFQIHEREVFESWIGMEQHRVVLMTADPDFDQALVLPWQKLASIFGWHFGSSFTWMLGMALLEGYTDISIHGVHLAHESEYGSQRDTFFWFLGMAEGRGIKFNIDEDSGIFVANHAYGVPL
jgi:hypothetical protein